MKVAEVLKAAESEGLEVGDGTTSVHGKVRTFLAQIAPAYEPAYAKPWNGIDPLIAALSSFSFT